MNRTVLADVRPLGSDLYDYDEQREGYQVTSSRLAN